MNLFIESIEGGTYLVAFDDGEARQYIRDNHSRPKAFHCISEIKSHFSGQQFDKVWLKQNTPYDEMCGMEAGTEKLEIEIDWR
ncbi:NADH-quinone reductase [Alteromonas sediminis]|uniref:NADH-quinone reductase n=1 Tax=Alteromonas sediminis TaxID=2259342 RepID=A0A3N5Y4J5_9ALTE|nr:DUF6482 family protein [Alteromonas sediminis]RPJ65069.1 NADH-quinone reductase [Alteromonas sediminis]